MMNLPGPWKGPIHGEGVAAVAAVDEETAEKPWILSRWNTRNFCRLRPERCPEARAPLLHEKLGNTIILQSSLRYLAPTSATTRRFEEEILKRVQSS